ncbi:MAG: hypothetical protein Q9174_005087 [Haloplaca sp. 1 TL-2023]
MAGPMEIDMSGPRNALLQNLQPPSKYCSPRRRVKCDEAKPTCTRCHASGFQCEGYSEPSLTWVVRSSGPQDRIRRGQDSGSQTPQTRPTTPNPAINPSAALPQVPSTSVDTVGRTLPAQSAALTIAPSSPYKTFEEQRALKVYFEQLAPMMSRFSDPDCWSVTIPKIAWHQTTARNALIAVSLVLTAVLEEPRRVRYGKDAVALNYMNATVRNFADQNPSIDVALTVGVLMFILETWMHHASIAMVHLKGAVAILTEYQQQIAAGAGVRDSEKDAVLNHLAPVIMIAVKMAEGFVAPQQNASTIDQQSPEALETRQRLTRPGVVDSFRDIVDVKNNLGGIAVKVARLQMRHHKDKVGVSETFIASDPDTDSSLEGQLNYCQGSLHHFDRLFAPVYDEHILECQYLAAHARTLYMMVQDAGADFSRDDVTFNSQLNDKSLLDTVSMAAAGALQSAPMFERELGLIPPIFYLAVKSQRCSLTARRAAANFLELGLGSRVEGRWSAKCAGRIAQEIISAGVEAGPDVDTFFPSFEVFDSTSSSSMVRDEERDHPELWLSCFRSLENSQGSLQTNPARSGSQAQRELVWRRCTSWTAEEIQGLPRRLNQLVGAYGYQGYFEDAIQTSAIV